MLWNSISTFIKMRFSVGDRLAEAFYGIWMVTVVTGIAKVSGEPTEQSVRLMLFAALVTNITWGIIDGLTSILPDFIDRTKEGELIHSLRTIVDFAQLRLEVGH
jgi:hypothetical protein